MSIIIRGIDQGSPEWFDLRKGIPTASNFGKILSPTGKPSTQDKAYMHKLVAESVIGIQEGYTNDAMEKGIETEPLARAEYELDTGLTVEEVAIVYLDDKKEVSCSPDGLVGEDGGLEIKCPLPHTHVKYLVEKKLPTEYIPQVQGSLYVTGRKWWDFVSYCEGLPTLRIRVERDEDYIKLLASALVKFNSNLKVTKQILGGF